MGGESGGELAGRELSGGILLPDLPEGEPVLGHLDGEQLILVRRGAEVFAVGATCSHYGGPLAEGLVVGETVRCPWHHACFSLRTGEALGPPALNPIPCWRVEVRDGYAFPRRREELPPLADLGRESAGPESVVIVGAGAAGSAAAEMLRRDGYAGPVTLVDPQESAPYDRPNLSKDYLAGNAPEEWIPLRPEGFYDEHGIERVLAEVLGIDTAARTVRLSNGDTRAYGALLLATGASPVRLSIPGADLPHVRTMRSLADCREIIARAERASRAVVLGASFIGMEVAASLRARGLEVSVVAPDAMPFERTLGARLGHLLQQLHESNGVSFHLGHTAAEILDDRVRLDDGSEIPAEVVVVGIGVRPELRLAEEAGLAVDGGVLVDAHLRASAPGVFAAGDIARWPDARTGERIRVEHWAVAQRQGQVAARNILGRDEPYEHAPFFWTQQYDLALAYVGHASAWERIQVDGDPEARDCAVRYLRGDRTLAVATIGRDRESLEIEAGMNGEGVNR